MQQQGKMTESVDPARAAAGSWQASRAGCRCCWGAPVTSATLRPLWTWVSPTCASSPGDGRVNARESATNHLPYAPQSCQERGRDKNHGRHTGAPAGTQRRNRFSRSSLGAGGASQANVRRSKSPSRPRRIADPEGPGIGRRPGSPGRDGTRVHHLCKRPVLDILHDVTELTAADAKGKCGRSRLQTASADGENAARAIGRIELERPTSSPG